MAGTGILICPTCCLRTMWRSKIQLITLHSTFSMDGSPCSPPRLLCHRSPYQIDFADYSAELVANLSDAWAVAHQNIKGAQMKQKTQYDKKSKPSPLKVDDRVMVHFPSTVREKAWKFAHPYFGPYRIIFLTPTNVDQLVKFSELISPTGKHYLLSIQTYNVPVIRRCPMRCGLGVVNVDVTDALRMDRRHLMQKGQEKIYHRLKNILGRLPVRDVEHRSKH